LAKKRIRDLSRTFAAFASFARHFHERPRHRASRTGSVCGSRLRCGLTFHLEADDVMGFDDPV